MIKNFVCQRASSRRRIADILVEARRDCKLKQSILSEAFKGELVK